MPDEETNYLNVNFKRTIKRKAIFKQLPISIEKLLSSLSSSKEIFKETAPYYEKYLSNCGYREKLNYRDPTSPNLITKRKHKETFYGLTHLIVRQSKQKPVSSFCS